MEGNAEYLWMGILWIGLLGLVSYIVWRFVEDGSEERIERMFLEEEWNEEDVPEEF